MQLRELREYCERRGWTVAGEYVDTGISGAKDRRPELDRLMADAHKRRFDVIAVWKFDRFARSVSHLLRALDTFRVLGIEFVSLSPAGRMVFTVLGAVAELERSLIAERVRAGLRNARAKAKIAGELGVGEGTVYRQAHASAKNPIVTALKPRPRQSESTMARSSLESHGAPGLFDWLSGRAILSTIAPTFPTSVSGFPQAKSSRPSRPRLAPQTTFDGDCRLVLSRSFL
jgi:hypothetical protein